MPRKWNNELSYQERKLLEIKIKDQEYLKGQAEIAAYLGCSLYAVYTCITYKGLPALRGLAARGETKFRGYTTTKKVVNQWIIQMYGQWLVEKGLIKGPPEPIPEPTPKQRLKGLRIPAHLVPLMEKAAANVKA